MPGTGRAWSHSKVNGWAAGPGSRENCRAEPKTLGSVLRVLGVGGEVW